MVEGAVFQPFWRCFAQEMDRSSRFFGVVAGEKAPGCRADFFLAKKNKNRSDSCYLHYPELFAYNVDG